MREVAATAKTKAMLPSDYQRLLNHFLQDGQFLPLLNGPERAKHQAEWRAFIAHHASLPPASLEDAEEFHVHWHVCHHYLRQVVDDEDAVLDMLWKCLPRYEGPARILFRGENVDRFDAGQVGQAWTTKIDVARMFARGLNAVSKGGVVLRVEAPASAIIAGSSKHSINMGEDEFTVDPRKLMRFETLDRFPPRF